MRRTMGLASRVYLISRKARFSRALFVIVTSEKRSWCRRTYRPVCRGMQRLNLRETRTENETGKFRAPFDVCHINQKAFLPNDKYVWHFFFFSQCNTSSRMSISSGYLLRSTARSSYFPMYNFNPIFSTNAIFILDRNNLILTKLSRANPISIGT